MPKPSRNDCKNGKQTNLQVERARMLHKNLK